MPDPVVLSDSLTLSPITYGVWRLADDPEGTGTAVVRRKIDACLEHGITSFDHADIYGGYRCEGLFGAALAEAPALRQQMQLVSKCGIRLPCPGLPGVDVHHYDTTKATVIACVERSLRELRTDHLDLLLIHRPDWLTPVDETAAALDQLLHQGKVLNVGVSNYSPEQFDRLQSRLAVPLVTNQVEISLLHMQALEDGTLDQAERLRRPPMAWSPLGGGRLFDGSAGRKPLIDALQQVAAAHGPDITPSQVALAWVAALPSRPVVVIGSNRPARIREAADAAGLSLTREQWFALWAAARGRAIP